MKKDKCPLCGGKARASDTDFLVCGKCCEMLTRNELVRFATRITRRRYQRNNAGA